MYSKVETPPGFPLKYRDTSIFVTTEISGDFCGLAQKGHPPGKHRRRLCPPVTIQEETVLTYLLSLIQFGDQTFELSRTQ